MTIKFGSKMRKVFGPCFLFDGGDDGGGDGGNDFFYGGGGGAGGSNDDGGNDRDGGDSGSNNNGGNDGGNGFNFDDFKNTYGKDYLTKPYMQGIDSPEKLFKELDTSQALIGKKLSIPGPDATEKEHEEYLSLIRPKDKEVYKFQESHLPDNLKGFHPDGFQDKVKDLFQEAALTPKQADIISQGYDKIMIGFNGEALSQFAEAQKASQLQDVNFDTLADKTWGQNRAEVQNVAKALIQEFAPDEFKPHLDKLSNENIVIMASVLKGVSDKYISQDDLTRLKGGFDGKTADSLKAMAQKELAELCSMSEFDSGYAAKQQRVNELYAQIGKMGGDK